MRNLRVIKIDTAKQLITEETIGEGIADIYEKLGCSTFSVAGNFNEQGSLADSLYVDDDGLSVPNNPIFTFNPPGWEFQTEFAGNGLIIGVNFDDGESVDARIPLFDLATYVEWTNKTT